MNFQDVDKNQAQRTDQLGGNYQMSPNQMSSHQMSPNQMPSHQMSPNQMSPNQMSWQNNDSFKQNEPKNKAIGKFTNIIEVLGWYVQRRL